MNQKQFYTMQICTADAYLALPVNAAPNFTKFTVVAENKRQAVINLVKGRSHDGIAHGSWVAIYPTESFYLEDGMITVLIG